MELKFCEAKTLRDGVELFLFPCRSYSNCFEIIVFV